LSVESQVSLDCCPNAYRLVIFLLQWVKGLRLQNYL
jgi:hypothetical protein